MERYVPASEIDARFDEVLSFADAGDTVFITVDEKPDTVLMSVDRYLDRFGSILSDEEISNIRMLRSDPGLTYGD